MKEKPKLKEADELLNRLGRKGRRTSSVLPGGEPPPVEDRSPLDFGKYVLPTKSHKKLDEIEVALQEQEEAPFSALPQEDATTVEAVDQDIPEPIPVSEEETQWEPEPEETGLPENENLPEPPVRIEEYEFESFGEADTEEAGQEPPIPGLNREKGPSKILKQLIEAAKEQELEEPDAQEEQIVEEDGKETLAQKFMKEREQYIQELGIGGSDDGPRQEKRSGKSSRRTLDYEVQPEMHIPGGGPVTYSPTGKVKPQTEGTDDEAIIGTASAMARGEGKKTGEQLLKELMEQTEAAAKRLDIQPATRSSQARRHTPRTSGAPSQRDHAMSNLSKKFVAVSAAAVFLVLCVLGWSAVMLAQGDKTVPDVAEHPATSESSTLTIYEDRSFDNRGQYADVLIKRAGIRVHNLSVQNLLVISEVESPGSVLLEDVSVEGAIHLKSCAADEIVLQDVKTPLVVISNADTDVLVTITGNSDIGAVELKTGGTVEQVTVDSDALGLRNLIIKGEEPGVPMNAAVRGLDLPTLTTSGETVLDFTETMVVDMNAEGSLLLSGSGRVVNLSVNAMGTGAAEAAASGKLDWDKHLVPLSLTDTLEESSQLSLLIQGVQVTNLTVRNPASMDLSAPIDRVSLSGDADIRGNGTVGSLLVNERSGSARTLIDMTDIHVVTATAETQTRFYLDGDAFIGTLIANSSTYTLGNKVGELQANADSVIYEEEPDRIIVASGVMPPETKADNLHLDYNLRTTSGAVDAALGDATCEHSPEEGGFTQGDGTQEHPFQVSTPAQLAHVHEHLGAYFIQTQDIDLSDDSAYSVSFPVIAREGTAFHGTYNGGGYQILNLRITSDSASVGLFGENVGVIQNVHIASGEINSTGNQNTYAAGIVGFNYEEGQVLSSANRARVNGRSAYTGGIVGYNFSGRIRDCYNVGKITANSNVGGIVGVNRQDAIVAGCYNVGTIEGESNVGSIAGINADSQVTNCYFLSETADLGVGQGEGTASERSATELQSAQTVADLGAGSENTLWTTGEGTYQYPTLKKPVIVLQND